MEDWSIQIAPYPDGIMLMAMAAPSFTMTLRIAHSQAIFLRV